MTKEEIESFLKETEIARFCSINKDGSIHAAPVWYKYETGRIIVVTPEASRKVRNVKRNRNVTVLVDIEQPTVKGVVIYGKAEVQYPLTREKYMSDAVSVFEKYMSKDEAERYAAGLFKVTRGVKIVVTPERMVSFDTNKDETLRALARGNMAPI
jgi:nitroimidazol reductase NimA-like FMN-containing flavoprotein (pyridoxamine 5'-phosphate oxidase superfamily)